MSSYHWMEMSERVTKIRVSIEVSYKTNKPSIINEPPLSQINLTFCEDKHQIEAVPDPVLGQTILAVSSSSVSLHTIKITQWKIANGDLPTLLQAPVLCLLHVALL